MDFSLVYSWMVYSLVVSICWMVYTTACTGMSICCMDMSISWMVYNLAVSICWMVYSLVVSICWMVYSLAVSICWMVYSLVVSIWSTAGQEWGNSCSTILLQSQNLFLCSFSLSGGMWPNLDKNTKVTWET